MLTLQTMAYIEGNDRTGGPIWNYATGTRHPGKGGKPDRVIQLSLGKCTPMLVINQPEHGRISTTVE